jgi:hypothetical protein
MTTKRVQILFKGEKLSMADLRKKFESMSIDHEKISVPKITIQRIFGCLNLAEIESSKDFTFSHLHDIHNVCRCFGECTLRPQKGKNNLIGVIFSNTKDLIRFLYDEDVLPALQEIQTS